MDGIIISHILPLEPTYSMLVPVIMIKTPLKEIRRTIKSIFDSATLKIRYESTARTKGVRFMTSDTKTRGKYLILVNRHIKPNDA